MAWTSHGHHINGTTMDDTVVPPRKMRCGGPGLCGKCSAEASRAINKMRIQALIDAPQGKKYITRRVVIEALQFDGSEESRNQILEWVNSTHGYSGEWQEWTHAIAVWRNSATEALVHEGDFLMKSEGGRFRRMSVQKFNELYEEHE